MEQNRDLNLSEMCLKGKKRKVTTKTCCDNNRKQFFSQRCLSSIQRLGLLFSGKLLFPFFSPLGIFDHTVRMDLKSKAGAEREGQGKRMVVQQDTDKTQIVMTGICQAN